MDEVDHNRFQMELAGVMSFYGQPVSKFTGRKWWDICKKFSFEQVSKAFDHHVAHSKFAPKPAEIIEFLEGSKTDKSLIAWSKVYEAMGSVGAWRDVVFDDPAIHATIQDMGGWVKLCRINTDEMSYTQHQFCKTHQAYSGRSDYPFPPLLVGASDSAERYKSFGLEKDAPSMVGNIEQCQKVMRLGSNTQGHVHQIYNMLPDSLKLEGVA